MLKNHYTKKIFVGLCDRNGVVKNGMERWDAHKKGALHRAFTLVIIYKNKLVVQHRKHPVFGGVLDITISSHQEYVNKNLEGFEKSALKTLEREWNIKKSDIVGEISDKGFVYYKAKDKYSGYTEHEICSVLKVKVKKLKSPNFEFAYGYSFISRNELKNINTRLYKSLAPWVKVMIKKGLL